MWTRPCVSLWRLEPLPPYVGITRSNYLSAGRTNRPPAYRAEKVNTHMYQGPEVWQRSHALRARETRIQLEITQLDWHLPLVLHLTPQMPGWVSAVVVLGLTNCSGTCRKTVLQVFFSFGVTVWHWRKDADDRRSGVKCVSGGADPASRIVATVRQEVRSDPM